MFTPESFLRKFETELDGRKTLADVSSRADTAEEVAAINPWSKAWD